MKSIPLPDPASSTAQPSVPETSTPGNQTFAAMQTVVDPQKVSQNAGQTQKNAEAWLWEEEDIFLSDPQMSGSFQQPFQISQTIPPVMPASGQLSGTVFPTNTVRPTSTPPSPPTLPIHKKSTSQTTLFKVALLSAVILIALSFVGVVVFAAGGSSQILPTQRVTQVRIQATPPQPTSQATPSPSHPTVQPTASPNTTEGNWVPDQLPDGWIQAHLNMGDALFALRTGITFTDREMSIDYRNIGTRSNHSGTLTAAVFLLTSGARQRFEQNDVRVATNALFDSVAGTQRIQAVINSQPALVAFQENGGQQFAWVQISFQLWQSHLDPQTGQRQDGLELVPNTNQPRTYQMFVLLLRVSPSAQDVNAPMGGSGWLVSNYALDPPNNALPNIIHPA